jgi:non-heme chloroperoxidase
MPRVAVGKENNTNIEIHYEDHGSGQPVLLIHGYPLDGNSWEKQQLVLIEAGYRVVTYDRRGFGASSKPAIGYDYDTFAADLKTLVEHLDLSEIILVGFSMGTGEVVRYLSTYGSGRVAKAVLVSAIPPFLLRTDDNPEGVDSTVFDAIKAAIVADRPAFIKNFLDDFYNIDIYRGTRVSDEAWESSFITAVGASPYATWACVDTWLTDYRADLPKINVPTLLIHGTADRILPYEATAARLPGLVKDLQLVTIEGGPHNVLWTHANEVNTAVLGFLGS